MSRSRGAGGPPRAAGFTLVELVVAMVIIAVLSAMAISSYTKSVQQGRRTDAVRALTWQRQALERCYSQSFSYQGCTVTVGATTSTLCTGATTSPNGYYQVACSNFGATTYTLTATPSGAQASDVGCASFAITQTGQQSAVDASGNTTTQACWGAQ
jgi:type IV pilus assembly protein PilE